MKKIEHLPEILGSLAILTVVNFIWARDNLGFIGVEPHPYWIAVLALAVKYELRTALAESISSALLYTFFLIFSHDIVLSQVFELQYFKPILLFLLIGGFIGQVRSNQNQKLHELQRDKDALDRKYATLKKRSREITRIKDELAERIVGQTSTVSTVYELAKKLNILEMEQLIPSALDFVVEVVGAEKCSFYRWDPVELSLKLEVTRGWLQDDKERYQMNIHNELIRNALTSRRPVVLTESFDQELETAPDVVEEDVVMSAPIFIGQNKSVHGVINIEKIPFLRFNPDSVRLFSLISDWISHSLTLALEFKRASFAADKSAQFEQYVRANFSGPFEFGLSLSKLRQRAE